MINLIKVELFKILKKKSIYVIWILMFIFCLLNNILYCTDYDEDGNYKYLEQENLKEEKLKLEQEILKYSKDNLNEVTMYITIKTKLDLVNLKEKFLYDSWQYQKLSDYLYDIIYQSYYYQYVEQDLDEYNFFENEYNLILDKLKSDNYQYFLNIDLNNKLKVQDDLSEKYSQETDEKIKLQLKEQIEDNRLDIKILNYRLKNDIKDDKSYLNSALKSYQENYKTVLYYQKMGEINLYQEKLNYQEAVSQLKISQYIIDNKLNINKQNNLNYQLRTIVEDYEIFLVVLILIVCGIIICDEFRDGTIKLLLIKPYSRGKILLSKYFAVVIMLIFSILMLIAMQLVIGGSIFGIESLDIPVVIYDFNKVEVVEYSIFQYMLIRILANMPFLLMLITISIFLGVLSSNMIISITIPLMMYMFSPTILYLANNYHLKFMKYLVTINWDISNYLFGKLSELSFINLKFSITILIIYFVIFWILTFGLFKRRNIKNI